MKSFQQQKKYKKRDVFHILFLARTELKTGITYVLSLDEIEIRTTSFTTNHHW